MREPFNHLYAEVVVVIRCACKVQPMRIELRNRDR
jgi:hypothetical protein